MKIARINAATGEVLNVEVWAQAPDDTTDHLFREAVNAGIGWVWDGTAFIAPPQPEPPRRLIPKSVVQERVNAIGKWGAVIGALMPGGVPSIYYGRWFTPDHPNVFFDDADMLAMLNAVGCTEAQIADITA